MDEVKEGTVTSEDIEIGDAGEDILFDPGAHVEIIREVLPAAVASPTEVPDHHKSRRTSWPTVIGFGVFLLLMIHAPPFRRAVFVLLNAVWRVVRAVLWDFPLAVWRSRAVKAVRQGRAVRFLYRYFWSPLLITLLVFAVMRLVGFTPRFLLLWGWAVWAVLTLAYNTPWGWVVQDRVAEAVSDWWRVVRVNLLPGLFQTIIDLFRRLANWIERRLYAVDEWFRFRGGDSKSSIVVKAILGLVWFPVAYVFRFAFYLLVEPQINPIKHFPVVTVSHKMLLPLVVTQDPQAEASIFGQVLVDQFNMTVGAANSWAVLIITGIPGIFGFMAWEFVANWRMYRANRPPRLRPVILGSHGETMRGLLRPGFHSGTVPKLFRKLRHATPEKASRLHHEIEHAAEAFTGSSSANCFTFSPAAGVGRHRDAVGAVRFRVPASRNRPRRRRWAATRLPGVRERRRPIEAAVVQMGWADKLTETQRVTFVGALRGLFDMAAAERLDGRERSEESPGGDGFGDLVHRVSWAEWVGRWGGTAHTQRAAVA